MRELQLDSSCDVHQSSRETKYFVNVIRKSMIINTKKYNREWMNIFIRTSVFIKFVCMSSDVSVESLAWIVFDSRLPDCLTSRNGTLNVLFFFLYTAPLFIFSVWNENIGTLPRKLLVSPEYSIMIPLSSEQLPF